MEKNLVEIFIHKVGSGIFCCIAYFVSAEYWMAKEGLHIQNGNK